MRNALDRSYRDRHLIVIGQDGTEKKKKLMLPLRQKVTYPIFNRKVKAKVMIK